MKVDRSLLFLPKELVETLQNRSMLIVAVGVLLVFGLGLRLFQLQILDHERYENRSRENRSVTQPLEPARGLIFDRNGEVLALNRQIQSLSVIGEDVDDVDALLERLREIIEFSSAEETEFRLRLDRVVRPGDSVILKRHLSDDELAIFAVNRYQYPDILVTTETLRDYPMGHLMSHVVGSVRQITIEDLRRLDEDRYGATKYVGRRGIEKFYEDVLHGQVGNRTVEVNVHGRVMKELDREPPQRGVTMTLHIDSQLQRVADEALGDRRGAVVAIDPETGGILALVSKPTYNPNDFVMGMSDEAFASLSNRRDTPLFNRATQGTYSPGSTFKPVIGLAALSLGVTDWEYEIDDPRGEFRLPNSSRVYRDWNWNPRTGGQQQVDLYRAIYRSSNIYFYDMSTKIEVDELAEFASQFGYGQNTAIDVTDPDPGLVPTSEWKRQTRNERWYPGDNINLFIGQGDMVATPLQLATVATLFANRGKWVRPRLLMSSAVPIEMDESIGDTPERVQGPTEEDWELMIDALRAVVHRGHQGYLQNGIAWAEIGMDIPYEMAGKSGTAQVVEIPQGEEYDETLLDEYQRKHALFIAFTPVQNPTIAVSVVVENGGGGSKVAGPVARAVLDAHMRQRVELARD